MKVWMIWHGGPNYVCGGIEDVEQFESLRAAAAEVLRRERGGDPYYPCVSESEAHVFLADPRTDPYAEVYPDRIITVGPRGGVQVVSA